MEVNDCESNSSAECDSDGNDKQIVIVPQAVGL